MSNNPNLSQGKGSEISSRTVQEGVIRRLAISMRQIILPLALFSSGVAEAQTVPAVKDGDLPGIRMEGKTDVSEWIGREIPFYMLNGKTVEQSAMAQFAKNAKIPPEEAERDYEIERLTEPKEGSKKRFAKMKRRVAKPAKAPEGNIENCLGRDLPFYVLNEKTVEQSAMAQFAKNAKIPPEEAERDYEIEKLTETKGGSRKGFVMMRRKGGEKKVEEKTDIKDEKSNGSTDILHTERKGSEATVFKMGDLSTGGGANSESKKLGDNKNGATVAKTSLVKEGEATLPDGEFSEKQWTRFLKLHSKAIERCIAEEQRRNPDIGGRMDLKVTIGSNGKIIEIEVMEDTLRNEKVKKNIENLLKSWTFPKLDNPVTYPMPIKFVKAS